MKRREGWRTSPRAGSRAPANPSADRSASARQHKPEWPQTRRRSVTPNFEANLAGIEAFRTDAGAPLAYHALLDRLLDAVIPILERFPRMGRPFLARPGLAAETRTATEQLKARAGRAEIRDYLIDGYLVLYVLIADTAYLVAIRHDRRLSFDFQRFWRT